MNEANSWTSSKDIENIHRNSFKYIWPSRHKLNVVVKKESRVKNFVQIPIIRVVAEIKIKRIGSAGRVRRLSMWDTCRKHVR